MNEFDTAMLQTRDTFLEVFGDTITYQPGVLDREITAIVKYIDDDSQVSPSVRHRSPSIQIKAANDSAIGIAASEFEPGQTISVPPREGADAVMKHLNRIIKQTTIFVWYEAK